MPSALINLLAAMTENPTKKCKLGDEMEKMDAETKDYLTEVLTTTPNSPLRLSHNSISVALKTEGYNVSSSTIRSHRTKECACYNKREESE